MKIALDYDQTYTADPRLWNNFINDATEKGHDVRIVTARNPTLDRIDVGDIPVIYCDGVAKRFVCHHFMCWDPDVWIDDKPQSVDNNSTASKEVLAEWRRTRDLPPEEQASKSYEPRPQQTTTDWEALGQLAIKRFPRLTKYLQQH